MAFPSTPMLDDFNRANGSLGANWTSPLYPGHVTPTIFSNAFVAVADNNGSSLWNPSTYLNCECYSTFTSTSDANSYGYVWTRLSSPGAGLNGLVVGYQPSANYWFMYRYIGGTGTLIIDSTHAGIVSGVQMGMRTTNVGADIVCEAYASGVLLTTATLSGGIASFPEVAVAGNIGTQVVGAGDSLTRSIDNFGGGEIGAGMPSIAFLSGTGW